MFNHRVKNRIIQPPLRSDREKSRSAIPHGFCFLLVLAASVGCSHSQLVNESYPVTVAQSKRALKEMRVAPQSLQRPVVVLGGFMDPGLALGHVARQLRRVADEDQIISIGFAGHRTFEQCRDLVIEKVDQAYPSSDPIWTAPVDVVALSMGGLVARLAAAPGDKPTGRRLRIARLFTISSPHRGANMADLPRFDQRQVDMRSGSARLKQLDDELEHCDYNLIPYVRLGDQVVGASNAAPPGCVPWWLPNQPFSPAHLASHRDPRILGDIARRIRGEVSFTLPPPCPLPSGDDRLNNTNNDVAVP